ncbi:monoheme cytochrome C [Gilvibacter sediminis]|uniref:monoheme cytochrome C n=1 Tax=Gilvibacter sediminis TaxID=379071 RepID=UPI002350E12E|nr:monoheme cytochrome C [Gilvibacter sediminis]MDC7996667.1 monoheme cytochrome C [Gilvibacter sediminis]
MNGPDAFKDQVKQLYRALTGLLIAFVVVVGLVMAYVNDPSLFESKDDSWVAVPEEDPDLIVDGIHQRTGLIEAEGLMAVVANCTSCHSAKLITQNRMNAERWNTTIAWMQETQNLWDLGDQQEVIVNYLVTNYPPKAKGRRMALTDIEWYELQ